MIKRLAGRILPKLLGWVPRNNKILYPFYLAGQLFIKEETKELSTLPLALDGLRITYASDIHYGPLKNKGEALRFYQKLISLESDLILLGGDYGDVLNNSIKFFELIPAFSEGTPVFAVLGNHDSWIGGQDRGPLLKAMREKGIIPLVNKTHLFQKNGHSIAICGPDDIKCGQPDFKPLIQDSKDADFVVFLPHSPDLIPEAFQVGFHFDLAICGHTHGGQIVLRGRSLHSSSIYRDRYRTGWFHEHGAAILVSEGIGTSILPIRIGTRAEINYLLLKAVPQG